MRGVRVFETAQLYSDVPAFQPRRNAARGTQQPSEVAVITAPRPSVGKRSPAAQPAMCGQNIAVLKGNAPVCEGRTRQRVAASEVVKCLW
jgi:hypothetical protein